jgi:CRISPR-associated protein Csx10
MKIIRYRIYLEQPLLATQIMGDPNSSVSFNYIPGSLVRGMLVHRSMQQQPSLDQAEVIRDPDCRRLFFSGETRYLNAYPLLQNGERSLPTPRALLRRKADPDSPVYNAAHTDFNYAEAEGEDLLKPFDTPFCWIDGDKLTSCRPQPSRIGIHTARDPRKGRATAASGAVFQYEALSADQWFAGVILVDTESDLTTLQKLLPGTAWLGRSRSAGYGQVRIELDPMKDTAWREVGGTAPKLSARNRVTLTLLSDTTLRDATGGYALRLDQATLETYLGVKVRQVHEESSFSSISISGGFNRTAQAPLVQGYSLGAGSCVTFTLDEPLDVANLEAQGIGERRVEGFGRIAFGWLDEKSELTALEGKRYDTKPNRSLLTPASQQIAHQMAQRLLDQAVEQKIALFIRDHVVKAARQMPRNSQLGRVRVLLRQAMREKHLQAMREKDPQAMREKDPQAMREKDPFAHERQALATFQPTGRQQFEDARFNGTNLWAWLNQLLGEAPRRDVWSELQLPRENWPRVAGEQATDDPGYTRSVTLRLIEATLTAASRQRKREEV